jgi:hypothetical protein
VSLRFQEKYLVVYIVSVLLQFKQMAFVYFSNENKDVLLRK